MATSVTDTLPKPHRGVVVRDYTLKHWEMMSAAFQGMRRRLGEDATSLRRVKVARRSIADQRRSDTEAAVAFAR